MSGALRASARLVQRAALTGASAFARDAGLYISLAVTALVPAIVITGFRMHWISALVSADSTIGVQLFSILEIIVHPVSLVYAHLTVLLAAHAQSEDRTARWTECLTDALHVLFRGVVVLFAKSLAAALPALLLAGVLLFAPEPPVWRGPATGFVYSFFVEVLFWTAFALIAVEWVGPREALARAWRLERGHRISITALASALLITRALVFAFSERLLTDTIVDDLDVEPALYMVFEGAFVALKAAVMLHAYRALHRTSETDERERMAAAFE